MSLRRRRWILCIEDNEDDLILIRAVLPKGLYPVTWAATGAEGLRRLADTRFDLIILDYGLTDTNGLSLLSEIRKRQPTLPVLVISGRQGDEVLVEALMRQGASAFLPKNHLMDELRPRLDGIFEKESPGTLNERAERESSRHPRFGDVLLEIMDETCLLVDVEGTISFANRAAEKLTGRAKERLLGARAESLFGRETWRRVRGLLSGDEEMTETSLRFEGSLWAGDHLLERDKPVLVTAHLLRVGELGGYQSLLLLLTDISPVTEMRNELRKKVGILEDLNRKDPLTGLGNRRGFEEKLAAEIRRSKRYGRPLSLLYADLDNLKIVNDTVGHEAGDEYITSYAGILEGILRQTDYAARIGGDEFAIILTETGSAEAEETLRRIKREIAAARGDRSKTAHPLSVSHGMAHMGRDGEDGDALRAAADSRLYEEKERHHAERGITGRDARGKEGYGHAA